MRIRHAWDKGIEAVGRGVTTVFRVPADLRSGPQEWCWDAALAVLVAVTALVHVTFAPPVRTDIDLLGYALALVGSLVLTARRRAPVAVLLVSTACVLTYQILGYPGVAAGLPVLVAIYTVVRAGQRGIAVAVTGIALAKGTAATILISVPEDSVRDVIESRLLLAGWLIASGVTAEVIRKQHAYLQEVEQRATEAERTQEEMALRRAGEERLRIARELHDSLTHSISVIKVQAGVAVHLARKRGEPVPDALLAIQEASRDATRELRSTLDVLRSEGDRVPSNGLDRLADLVASAQAAGVPVAVSVTGDRRRLPREVESTAYRIVQEALTNVTRHAGPAKASVQLDYLPGRLIVQIEDDGSATPDSPPVPGMGLRGMDERVSAIGGRLTAEPRAEGGFRVRTELPTADADLPVAVGPPAPADLAVDLGPAALDSEDSGARVPSGLTVPAARPDGETL